MPGTKEINSHIEVKGKAIIYTVPNNTGTVVTYNLITKELSSRTNAEIISDLNLVTTNTVQTIKELKNFTVTPTVPTNTVNPFGAVNLEQLEDYTTDGNTAFSWGNHALAGYLTSTSLTNYATLHTPQSFIATKTFTDSLVIQGNTTDNRTTKIVFKNSASTTDWAISHGLYGFLNEGFSIGKWNNNIFEVGLYISNGFTLNTANDGDSSQWQNAYNWVSTNGASVLANSHTHSNKVLLDSYNQTNVDIIDAVSKKHTHTNQMILDNITAQHFINWQTAFGWENHALAGYLTSASLTGYATETWTNTNFIPKSHPVYNVTQGQITGWESSHKVDSTTLINNGSNGRHNKTWFDYSWAGTGKLGSVLNFAGFDGYNAEIFIQYSVGNELGFRTRNGDTGVWNPVRWGWHSGNLQGYREIEIDTGLIRLKPLELNFGAGNHVFSNPSRLIRVICNDATGINITELFPHQEYVIYNKSTIKGLNVDVGGVNKFGIKTKAFRRFYVTEHLEMLVEPMVTLTVM